jgi:hypothetical protein
MEIIGPMRNKKGQFVQGHKIHLKHGEAIKGKETTEYNSWRKMRERCCDPKNNRWEYYGGKGINVCERWINSYENFLKDMGRKPTPKHTLGRINSSLDYTPDNCRWETYTEQNNNRGDYNVKNRK